MIANNSIRMECHAINIPTRMQSIFYERIFGPSGICSSGCSLPHANLSR